MSRHKVLLHVGTPKTGTSHLQDVLFRNREVLRQHGILYPAERFDGQFLAALDLLRMPWGGLETEAVGEWDALAEQVRNWRGTSIISHEVFAGASRTEVARALSSLGDAEVHLVVSARDLVRQIPAEWQENVKHRRTFKYGAFLQEIRDPERSSRIATWFWGVQELPDILDRWGASLPPERVHLCTLPNPGAPQSLLCERFEAVLGVSGVPEDLHAERANPSLGVPETALLRRINAAVVRELEPADYRPLVRELLAHRSLSRRTGSPRLGVPVDVHTWAAELAAAWGEELGKRGYDVVGDLADLLPDPWPGEFDDPDRPRESQVNAAAIEAIRVLLLEGARLQRAEADALARLHDTEEALRRAYLRPSYLLREKTVRSLERSGAGRGLMNVYRRARGRSSRSA